MPVLRVEDALSSVEPSRSALREDGYIADPAPDGPEGLWHAQEFHYDVLDLALTGWTPWRCAGGCAAAGAAPRS